MIKNFYNWMLLKEDDAVFALLFRILIFMLVPAITIGLSATLALTATAVLTQDTTTALAAGLITFSLMTIKFCIEVIKASR